jgi:hypothetical protein
MDLGDITQLAVVATITLVFGRIGWSLARLIDRRASRQPSVSEEAAERIRSLEEEQMALRQELAELQERQDFAERAMLREQRPRADIAAPERVVTPH